MMMKKNLLFVLALLVSMSFIVVSCKDKNDDVVEGAFAADVAGTYVGTIKYPAAAKLAGMEDEDVEILVEKTGESTVSISYLPIGEEEGGVDGNEDGNQDGTGVEEADEEEIVNIVVKKQGNKYIFVETEFEDQDEQGNSLKNVLSGYVVDKKITLTLKTNMQSKVFTTSIEGTLKEN
ncbi:MAG: hypothetical protein II502_00850 [Paludibacteraceae bacterium]|nr:hypothetical protein [Paludibacteraceae bacterium]